MTFKKGVSLCMMLTMLFFPVYLMADTAADPATEPADQMAQDDPGDNGDQVTTGSAEEPTYSNPAQAMHAAQLAESASLQPNEATREAAEDLETAREAYDKAYRESLADPETPAVAEALTLAEQDLEQARKAYAEQIGELAGVMGKEIQAMRQERMGWGQIAHELGVHPGALGLGHSKHKGVLDPV
ncbi:MAG: hypothetical protein IH612_04485, partial [Desulfofustis sp.]|nr:hypothetical protein [Desulfofustis sp.]